MLFFLKRSCNMKIVKHFFDQTAWARCLPEFLIISCKFRLRCIVHFLNWKQCNFRNKNFVKLPSILAFFKIYELHCMCCQWLDIVLPLEFEITVNFTNFFFGINKISGNCHILIALFFEFYSTNVCCHGSTFFFRLDWNHFGVHLVDHRWSYIGS